MLTIPPDSSQSADILTTLRADPSSWSRLIAFRPTVSDSAFTDSNMHNRYTTLLALHTSHQTTLEGSDLPLIHYLLDQEIRYNLSADSSCSSLSLACYLLSRFRDLDSGGFWAIWAGRYTNFDASICVDVHYLYYIAGGMEQAATYIRGCTVEALLEGAGEGRRAWWRALKRHYNGDEGKAFEELKTEVLERIKHDSKYGITEEKVIDFVERSWRSDTAPWAASLLSEEYP